MQSDQEDPYRILELVSIRFPINTRRLRHAPEERSHWLSRVMAWFPCQRAALEPVNPPFPLSLKPAQVL